MDIIEARARDLGGFVVRRVLPTPRRRAVGPFVFLDLIGPTSFPAGHGIDVRPHPHIGLSTLTFLFEGALRHRDSLGTVIDIRPGEVNWMTAGRGIQHSERTPPLERATGHRLFGIQLWAALPRPHEDDPPAFAHFDEPAVPIVAHDGRRLRVVAGEVEGVTGPVAMPHPGFLAVVELADGAAWTLVPEAGECAVLVAAGAVAWSGGQAGEGLLLLPPAAPVRFEARSPALLVALGGAPLDGPRHLWWNLVASRPERIRDAARDRAAAPVGGRFGSIPDESEWIPLPDEPLP